MPYTPNNNLYLPPFESAGIDEWNAMYAGFAAVDNRLGVLVDNLGAAGDGTTDDGPIIQAADDLAANSGNPNAAVIFGPKQYKISTQVNKSYKTNWQGFGAANPYVSGSGTVLINGVDGQMIRTIETPYTYSYYAGRMSDMTLFNDLDIHPAATAIYLQGVRQLSFQRMMILGFYTGMYQNACGEIYTDLFFSDAVNSIRSLNGADNNYLRTFLGGFNASGSVGYLGEGDGNITFSDCRFQMCKAGYGVEIVGGWGFQFSNCTCDGNELGGFWLLHPFDVSINNCRFLANGTTSVPAAAIDISSTSYDIASINTTDNTITFAADTTLQFLSPVRLTTTDTLPTGLTTGRDYWLYRQSGHTVYKICNTLTDARAGTAIDLTDSGVGTHTVVAVGRNINLSGGQIYDENYPQSSGKTQEIGLNVNQGTGIIDRLTLTGVDLSRCDTPVNFVAGISNLSFSNCQGLEPWEADDNTAALALGLAKGAVYRITGSDQMGVVH